MFSRSNFISPICLTSASARCCFFLAFVFSLNVAAQVSIKEQMDPRDYEGPVVDLSGPWEFYWGELLTPEALKDRVPAERMPVPGSWNNHSSHPMLGFATYRTKVKMPGTQVGQSLYLPIVNTASRVWVNGQWAAETGVVGTSEGTAWAKLRGIVVPVPDRAEEVEVVVQVSNFNFYAGGIEGKPVIRETAMLTTEISRRNGVENLFAGCLIALFVYQIILYFLYHRGKPHLWLALICLGVAIRSLTMHGGSFLLPELFPNASWELWKKFEYGSVYAILVLFPLYVFHLFRASAPRWPVIVFSVVSLLLLALVMVTPQYVYGRFLEVLHVGLFAGFVYAVYTISKAWRAGNEDARIILFGVLTCFPFILAEILKNSVFFQLKIPFMYLVEIGVLVFLLFQVYLLASHYAKSYRSLERMNVDLEGIVEARTSELVKANTVKERLLSVLSHDVRSPINSLRGMLEIYHAGAMNQEEFRHFSTQLDVDLSNTGMMVDNILSWTVAQIKGITVQVEKIDLTELVDHNFRLFATLASAKQISLKHNLPAKMEVKADRNIMNLVIRNLLSNAIKFSFQEAVIEVSAEKEKGMFLFIVRDYGTGMDDARIKMLFSPVISPSQSGTSKEKGTGLGLNLCQDYLSKAGASLMVRSTVGQGTTFTTLWPQ